MAGPPARRDAVPDPRRPLRARPPRRPGPLLCASWWPSASTRRAKRSILGVSVSLSEAEAHWRDFLASLHARGLHGVKLVVSDAHAGLKPALDARLTGVPWQRCQFHLIENALAFVPKPAMRKAVVASLRAVFDAPDRPEAERQLEIAVKKYRATRPEAGRVAGGERAARGWRSSPCRRRTGGGCGRSTCWSG